MSRWGISGLLVCFYHILYVNEDSHPQFFKADENEPQQQSHKNAIIYFILLVH